jgi:hypothetical protein
LSSPKAADLPESQSLVKSTKQLRIFFAIFLFIFFPFLGNSTLLIMKKIFWVNPTNGSGLATSERLKKA